MSTWMSESKPMLKVVRRSRRRQRGMTLLEIIVVITILGILAAAVSVAVLPALEDAKRDTAKLDIRNIQTALKTFYAKKGGYPDTGAGLRALVDAQLLDRLPIDPWGTEYVYLNEGGKPVILSYARDKAPGGDDKDADISSSDADGK